ncbi:MAG: ATP-dependent helicase [Brooklawnia sp.]
MTQTRLLPPQALREPGPLTGEQQAVVGASSQDSAATCVLGGPGTGKTTALVACVAERVRAGADLSQLVVLASSRPAAQKLRARIMAAVGRTQRGLQVTTVHGWCLQLLHRFADSEHPAPRLLSGPEQEFRVRELLAGIDQLDWPEELRPALGTRGFAREIRRILARARQFGFDPDDLLAASRAHGRPEWAAVAGFFAEYLDVLDAEGVIDYAELVHRARLLMLDTQMPAQLQQFATHIFCDDFAELDRGMIHLLADAHRAGSGLTVFADPDTSVFGFRGADPRAVADFADRFDLPGADSQVVGLTRNLRSAPDVVAASAHIAGRLPQRGVGHPVPGEVGAGVRVVTAPDATSQALQIADDLRRAHLVDGIPWAQMAVLTRSGRNAVSSLARRLVAAGVPVQVAGDEVALADEPAVQHLLAVLQAAVQLAQEQALGDQQAAHLLRTPLGGLDALGLRRLGRELRQREAAASPGEPIAPSGQLIAEELVRTHLVADDQMRGELGLLVRLRNLLAQLAGMVRQGSDLPSLLWRAWNNTGWDAQLQKTALAGSENSVRAHRDLDAVIALFDVVAREPGWAGATGVRSLVAEVASQQIPADTARESDPRRQGVSVATVHRSKGEQWRLVFLTGLQEGEWPTHGAPGGLLRADLLGPDGLQSPQTATERLAEERRSLLLGASRAVEQLVVCAVDDPSGAVAAPSRFIEEFGVPVQPGLQQQLPTTLNGLVSLLRRTATDEAAGPELRQLAATELAWLAGQTDQSGTPLAPGADPRDWWVLRTPTHNPAASVQPEEPVRLNSSAVDTLLECPRGWFLENQAHGRPPASDSQTVGTLIHELVALASTEGVPAASLTAELESKWPQLGLQPEWYQLAKKEAVKQALANFDAWTAARGHREVLGVELRFTHALEIDGVQVEVRGSLDRLEMDKDGKLHIVDFKTGNTAVSVEKAKSVSQLGIYQLAAREGAFDGLSGGTRELAGADLVYLAKPVKKEGATSRRQPPLEESDQTWVHQNLASAAAIIRDEDFHARRGPRCKNCAFLQGCPVQYMGVE